MDTRREFLKKAILLSGASGISGLVPASIQRAFAIDPAPGSTYLDAEHIVILMQENRSFDHCFGTLQGVRGFNDPRAITLPDRKPVWLQTTETGETYSPFRLNIRDTKVTWMGSLPHSRSSQVDAHNGGKYDRWLTAKKSGNPKYANMPLTLGYYTREDLPFNYALADAFTICDQSFCSAMTSTTPNRSFFWTGKIMSEDNGLAKANIRNDDYKYAGQTWKTFPELLQENDIAWKFYQNELSCGGGFEGEERSWLSNFGCNLLEFFAAYNVKYAPRYIQGLQKQADTLPAEIQRLQGSTSGSDSAAAKIRTSIAKKMEVLDNAKGELTKWNLDRFNDLSEKEKKLFANAFTINSGDPDYRSITSVKYNDGSQPREIVVPRGDVFYQFREDVNAGKLPTVSWLAGPQNFSDHPSAPWFGAWYVSEIMDILTKNPDVWKKTIFITTYDENDGYFDHVVPFSIADNNKPGTGKCSAGIETEIEHVRLDNELRQGIPKKEAREAPVGLGFRIPTIIASPWSRGGKVCSELFDHTSTLQFLESFINQKFKKNIHSDNISRWRRTICGDLTSAFTRDDGARLKQLPFLNRNKFVEEINNAKFKDIPSGYRRWAPEEIEKTIAARHHDELMAIQEKGTRASCALPYELYADGYYDPAEKSFALQMTAGNKHFDSRSAGSPFMVSVPAKFIGDNGGAEDFRNWSFAVMAGDTLHYQWPASGFAEGSYHLRVYGPNGFYREFKGPHDDPPATMRLEYERNTSSGKPTGNAILKIRHGAYPCTVVITDGAYKSAAITKALNANGTSEIVLRLGKQMGWYDFRVNVRGNKLFEQSYAGRVETGKESISDPFMGRVV